MQVSGIRCQVSGIRYQVSGARYQVSGARYQVSGTRCQVPGIRYQVSPYQVSGIRYHVPHQTMCRHAEQKDGVRLAMCGLLASGCGLGQPAIAHVAAC